MLIGQNIYEMRKSKDITQEVLASAMGVSAQAVSKWESGGTPDIELLPKIADYFGVSLDSLFGRNANEINNLETEITRSLAETLDEKSKFRMAFEYCWAIEKGMVGVTDNVSTTKEIADQHSQMIHSQVVVDEGFTSMSFNEKLQYFYIMPEPEAGWKEKLGYSEQYLDLFEFLSDRNVLRLLFFLNTRDNKPFTPHLVEKTLGVEEAEASLIIEALLNRKFLETGVIELDDELKTIYTFRSNPAFIGLLAMCEVLLHNVTSFYCCRGRRNKPYLADLK